VVNKEAWDATKTTDMQQDGGSGRSDIIVLLQSRTTKAHHFYCG